MSDVQSETIETVVDEVVLDDGTVIDEVSVEVESGPVKPSKAELLDQEGDAAADYLEALLDIADLDGDIEMDVEGNRAMVSILEINDGDLQHLVGRDGKVLEALQELTRLAATRETGERSRLMLDIAGAACSTRSPTSRAGSGRSPAPCDTPVTPAAFIPMMSPYVDRRVCAASIRTPAHTTWIACG